MCYDKELFAMKIRGFSDAVENLKASGADDLQGRLFFMWFTEEERERILLTEYEYHLDTDKEGEVNER